MARAARGRLLACLAAGAAAAAAAAGAGGDSLSLIQAGVHTQNAAAVKPGDGLGREFTFVRRVDALEPNSSMLFQVTRGCKVRDQYGANDCALRWGARNPAVFMLHLGGGLHRGDRLFVGLKTNAMTHNTFMEGLGGLFDGEEFEATWECQLCEGACTVNYTKLGYYVKARVPSTLDGPEVCDNLEKVTDVPFLNSTMLPLSPFGQEFDVGWLKMTGDIHARIAVANREGEKRVDETFSFKVGVNHALQDPVPMSMLQQGAEQQQARSLLGLVRDVAGHSFRRLLWGWGKHNGKAAQDAAAETEGEEEQHTERQKGRQQAKQQSRSESRGQFFRRRERPEVATSASQDMRRLVGKTSTLRLRLQVWYLENSTGDNISVTEPKYCKTMDRAGSFDCMFPFDAEMALKVSASLFQNVQPGDTLDVKIEPKVDGLLGKTLRTFKLLEPQQTQLPLCSENPQPMDIEMGGQTHLYTPPKCGLFSLEADLPSWVFKLPNYGLLPVEPPEVLKELPYVPKHLSTFPPVRFTATMTAKRQDETPIASVSLDLGFE